MNLFNSMIIIPSISLTSLSTIMMSSILPIWFMMEINNFMFISFLIMFTKQKKMIFIYFLIQVLASFIILYSLIINPTLMNYTNQMIITGALFLKSGIPPFHLWMPLLSKFMTWMSIFMMLTIQKIPPLMLFFLLIIKKEVFMFLMIMTMIVPPLAMFNTNKMKILIVYSSINQTGWIVMLIYLKHQFWTIYMLFYSIMMFLISMMLNFTSISTKFFMYTFKKFNIMFTSMMMNLASMPPFSFFMFKWFSTFTFIWNSNIKMMIILMLFNSLIMTFIYIKMMTWSLFINKFESKLIFNKTPIKLNKSILILMSIMAPMFLIL
nr:TPA_asm: NADH dehydrogenase subunit 2 [Pseudomyrmex elongatus]